MGSVTSAGRTRALIGALVLAMIAVVTSPSVAEATEDRHIEFVVDVSGSMAGSRLRQAQTALRSSVDGLQADDRAALRSYAGSCGNGGRLLVPFGTDNRDALRSAVDGLRAGGNTPTPDALRAAAADMQGVGDGVLILISDGASTCGNPCPVAQQIAADPDLSLRAFTVGFRAPSSAEAELACIAEATGGQYFSADDTDGLEDAIGDALQAAGRYVALGDSYSSGEGADAYEEGTDTDYGSPPGDGCRRSANAYPELVAADQSTPSELDFVACSGARTWHFYEAQKSTHDAQFEEADLLEGAVDPDTELITLTIGGNDAGFADILKECALGFEILPFNDCVSEDHKTETPFQEAFSRLKGEEVDDDAAGDDRTRPLSEIYGDIRERAPEARVLVVGYPQFYKSSGTLFMRCSGLKKADQLWANEKVQELNDYIARTARRFGFEFVETSSAFEGHRLCELGGGEEREWFRDLQPFDDPQAQYHPDADGHAAMAEQVLTKLEQPRPGQSTSMRTGDRITYSVIVDIGQRLVDFFSSWPGSDVAMTVTSPSGVEHSRTIVQPGSIRRTEAVFEHLTVTDPEAGTWTATLEGLDLDPTGETVWFTSSQSGPDNLAPDARLAVDVTGRVLTLDATGSSDPDGSIDRYTWFISDSEGTLAELDGPQVRYELDGFGDFGVTLRVEDDGGRAAYDGVDGGVSMAYEIDGPQPPVAAAPAVNEDRAGRTIPVKWRTVLNGEAVTDPASIVATTSRAADCATWEPQGPTEAVSGDHKLTGDRWHLNWRTDRAWAGSCRLLAIDLDDGSSLTTRHRLR